MQCDGNGEVRLTPKTWMHWVVKSVRTPLAGMASASLQGAATLPFATVVNVLLWIVQNPRVPVVNVGSLGATIQLAVVECVVLN